MSEDELFRGLRNDDPKSWKHLYDTYWNRLLHHIYHRLPATVKDRNEEAREIVAATFSAVNEAIESGRYVNRTAKVSTYLYAIANNRCSNYLRDRIRKNSNQTPAPELYDNFESVIQHEEQIILMRKALDLLPEPCRTLLILFYLEGLKHDEIAEIMDHYKNGDSTKAAKPGCLKKLKRIFDDLNKNNPDH
ncbi:MAG: sigma-70 family RNA polymerase sigma factor [Bacteroidota bacterium]